MTATHANSTHGYWWVVNINMKSGRSSLETDLTEDSLARKQFGAQTNYKAHHCEATIPRLSKVAEAESGLS
jgi:hypothetical protein